MSAVPAQVIGKAALADLLGWTRPKLDRRLKTDPNFPVLKRGTQQGGWEFDRAQVDSYLNGGVKPAKAKRSAPQAIDKAQLRDAVKPVTPAHTRPPASSPPRQPAQHGGEATARQRKDNADAALRENKLRIENGELVDRSELRQDLAKVLASIGNDLDGLPEAIATLIEAPDEAPRIRELIDKVRTQMVQNASGLLADD